MTIYTDNQTFDCDESKREIEIVADGHLPNLWINQPKSTFPLLQIEAGTGNWPLLALENGHRVICSDKVNARLQRIKETVPSKFVNQIEFYPGKFPDDVHLNDSSVSSILCLRVLHFFEGDALNNIMKEMYNVLSPGGRIFATAETPYLKTWWFFEQIFEQRLSKKSPFPGLIKYSDEENLAESPKRAPRSFHVFNAETFSQLFSSHQFNVEKVFYIDCRGVFPDVTLSQDRRDCVGIIAQKTL